MLSAKYDAEMLAAVQATDEVGVVGLNIYSKTGFHGRLQLHLTTVKVNTLASVTSQMQRIFYVTNNNTKNFHF